jgi:hypothetical protein
MSTDVRGAVNDSDGTIDGVTNRQVKDPYYYFHALWIYDNSMILTVHLHVSIDSFDLRLDVKI